MSPEFLSKLSMLTSLTSGRYVQTVTPLLITSCSGREILYFSPFTVSLPLNSSLIFSTSLVNVQEKLASYAGIDLYFSPIASSISSAFGSYWAKVTCTKTNKMTANNDFFIVIERMKLGLTVFFPQIIQ